jgi:hypothetical protein
MEKWKYSSESGIKYGREKGAPEEFQATYWAVDAALGPRK